MRTLDIRLFFFDLGGVLVHIDFDKALRRFADAAQLSTNDAAVVWHQFGNLHQLYERGEISTLKWRAQLRLKLGDPLFDQAMEIFSRMFELDPEILHVAEQLDARFTISLLSNTNPLHFYRIMNDYPALHIFHDPVTSYQVKSLKPEAEIYHRACKRHGRSPSECVFIDDRLENVQAAENLGMIGIHFQSHAHLIADLHTLGITIQ